MCRLLEGIRQIRQVVVCSSPGERLAVAAGVILSQMMTLTELLPCQPSNLKPGDRRVVEIAISARLGYKGYERSILN